MRTLFTAATMLLLTALAPDPILIAQEAEGSTAEHPERSETANLDAPPADPVPYAERVQLFFYKFETAFRHDDRQSMEQLVRLNRNCLVDVILNMIEDHFERCIRAGKIEAPARSPGMSRSLLVAQLHSESFEKPGLATAVRKMSRWPLDKIDRWVTAADRFQRSSVSFNVTRDPTAIETSIECLAEFRDLGAPFHTIMVLSSIATHRIEKGELEEAILLLEEALEMTEALDDVRRTAECLQKLANAHVRSENLRNALDLAERSHELFMKMGSPVEALVSRTMRLAVLHAMGRSTEALAEMRNVVDFYKRKGETQHAATYLCNLAILIHSESHPLNEAMAACEEALELARLIGDKRIEAVALRSRGQILSDRCRYTEAEENLVESCRILKRLEIVPEYSEALAMLVYAVKDAGRYEDALRLAENGLKEIEGRGSPTGTFKLRQLIAGIHDRLGDREQAEWWYRYALDLAENSETSMHLSQVYSSMCSFHLGGCRFAQALDCADKAVQFADQPGVEILLRDAWCNVAHVHRNIGRPDLARPYIEKCLLRYPGECDDAQFLTYRMERAMCLVQEKDLLMAEAELRGIQATAREQGYDKIRLRATRLLAESLRLRGRPEEALAILEKILGDENTLNDPELTWLIRNNMALIHHNAGRFDQALEVVGDADRLIREVPLRPTLRHKAKMVLGCIHSRSGRHEEALGCFEICHDLQKKILAQSSRLTALTQSSLIIDAHAVKLEALYCCRELFRRTGDRKYLRRALQFDEETKARSFILSLASEGVDMGQCLPSDLNARFQECLSRIRALEMELTSRAENAGSGCGASPASSRRRELKAKLLAQEKQLEEVIGQLKRRVPERTEFYAFEPIGLAALQQQLEPGTAYLSYGLNETVAFVLAVTNKGVYLHEIAESKILEERTRDLLSCLRDPGSKAEAFAPLARDLFTQLVGPVEKAIAGCDRLLISPDGILNFLPFEVLLATEPPAEAKRFSEMDYLLDRYSTTYVPSATSYITLANRRSARDAADAGGGHDGEQYKKIVAVGDIAYGHGEETSTHTTHVSRSGLTVLDPPRGDLTPLAHSRREVEAIEALFGKDRVILLTGEAVNEDSLRELCREGVQILHIAAHARTDADTPFISGIVLHAQDRRKETDGYWRVFEVYNTPIDAELVVLSACSTNIGRCVTGEGVFGLTRAFLQSGADAVLATNWEVRDGFTADFMSGFYRAMVTANTPRDEALRWVKQAAVRGRLARVAGSKADSARTIDYVSDAEPTDYSHPYYWAPFILTGIPH